MSSYLLPYQIEWVNATERYLIYIKSRRIGITLGQAYKSVKKRLLTNSHEIFVSKNQSTSIEYIRYCKKFAEVLNLACQEEVIDIAGSSTQRLTFPNGSRIIALSSNPDGLRGQGEGITDVTLDEFAWHEQAGELLVAAQPIILWGGTLSLVSTPSGPASIFQQVYNEAPKNGYRTFRTTLPQAVEQGIHLKVPGDHGTDGNKFIESVKRGCISEGAYKQEYLCEISGEETIVSEEVYRKCIIPDFKILDNLPIRTKYNRLFVGVDIGRTKNLTTIWVLELGHDKTQPEHSQQVFRTVAKLDLTAMPFNAQYQVIDNFLHHPSVCRCCIDAGGIGMQLAEELVASHGNKVEKVYIGATAKAELVERAAKFLFQERVSVPDDKETMEDICAMKRLPRASGGFSYDGNSGANSHCDRFMALALALQASEQPVFKVIGSQTDR